MMSSKIDPHTKNRSCVAYRNRVLVAVAYGAAATHFAPILAVGEDPGVGSVREARTADRTVPEVEPPEPARASSETPASREIFRARVFAEPLVPVGGEPGAQENTALVVVLFGYAKRNG